MHCYMVSGDSEAACGGMIFITDVINNLASDGWISAWLEWANYTVGEDEHEWIWECETKILCFRLLWRRRLNWLTKKEWSAVMDQFVSLVFLDRYKSHSVSCPVNATIRNEKKELSLERSLDVFESNLHWGEACVITGDSVGLYIKRQKQHSCLYHSTMWQWRTEAKY